jgi:hypothetical protein
MMKHCVGWCIVLTNTMDCAQTNCRGEELQPELIIERSGRCVRRGRRRKEGVQAKMILEHA